MSLLFNRLFRLVIAFLPRSECLFNFMTAVTICNDFGAPKVKSVTVSTISPSLCHEVMGSDAMILVFWMLSFKPIFSLSSFTFIRRLGSSSLLSAMRVRCHLHISGYWYFSQQSWFQLVLHPAWRFSWCTLHISYISRVTIYSLDVLLSQFGTTLLFHVNQGQTAAFSGATFHLLFGPLCWFPHSQSTREFKGHFNNVSKHIPFHCLALKVLKFVEINVFYFVVSSIAYASFLSQV